MSQHRRCPRGSLQRSSSGSTRSWWRRCGSAPGGAIGLCRGGRGDDEPGAAKTRGFPTGSSAPAARSWARPRNAPPVVPAERLRNRAARGDRRSRRTGCAGRRAPGRVCAPRRASCSRASGAAAPAGADDRARCAAGRASPSRAGRPGASRPARAGVAAPPVATPSGTVPVATLARRKNVAASSVARRALTETSTTWPCPSMAR